MKRTRDSDHVQPYLLLRSKNGFIGLSSNLAANNVERDAVPFSIWTESLRGSNKNRTTSTHSDMTSEEDGGKKLSYWTIVGVIATLVALALGTLEGYVAGLLLAVAVLCVSGAIYAYLRNSSPALLYAMVLASSTSVVALVFVLLPRVVDADPPVEPQPQFQSDAPPEYLYYNKASTAFEDIGATLAQGGFIEQSFIARQPEIGSIAVIAGRERNPSERFDDDNIGTLRLELFRVQNQEFTRLEAVPIGLAGSASVSASGVTTTAGRNRDTIFHLKPMRVELSERYLFRITNETDAIVAISVRPEPIPDLPTFISPPDGPRRRYEFAVSGYVCSAARGCS